MHAQHLIQKFNTIYYNFNGILFINVSKISGSGALPGKMLLVKIIEYYKIDFYFRSGYVKERLALPRKVWNGIDMAP